MTLDTGKKFIGVRRKETLFFLLLLVLRPRLHLGARPAGPEASCGGDVPLGDHLAGAGGAGAVPGQGHLHHPGSQAHGDRDVPHHDSLSCVRVRLQGGRTEQVY